jgi:NADH:ubiquinone oxidoreductase subunit 3 (subunit A)
MDAREAATRQIGGDDAITTRMGAVILPIGVVLIAISEIFHPAREDPMDFPAVFEEYAQSNVWTTVHLGEYCGFLLGGLVALHYSVSARPGAGAGLAPFGFAAAVTTAASFTVLQAVDGITLRYAVDAWASAPAPQKAAAFAAAEVARWTEIGMNSLSFFLAGLTLLLFGLAIALGKVYPRWVGLMATVSGAAFMYDGAVVVAYEGFVQSIVKVVGLLLLAVWAFVMAAFMWRNVSRRRLARPGSTPTESAQRPASTR